MTLPMVVPDREPLTEAEARRIGVSAMQIAALRGVLGATPLSCILTIKTDKGMSSLALGQLDTTAAIGLLIDREAQLLSSFGVAVEQSQES